MPVLYNSQEVVPVSTVSFSGESYNLGDGRKAGGTVRASVRGSIVPDKLGGVYAPISDVDNKMSTILQQQANLRTIFGPQGKTFEVQGWDGVATSRFQARILSIEFEEGPWIDKCDYVVTLESSEFAGDTSVGEHVQSASESWQFEEGDRPSETRATHTVQAKGVLVYDATGAIPKAAWEYARDYAKDKLGLGWAALSSDWSPKSGSNLADASSRPISANSAWNRVVNETIDELEGSYQVTETFVLYPTAYAEDYTVSVRRTDSDPGSLIQATISGTITGLFRGADTEDFSVRYTNAQAGWAAIQPLLSSRINAAAGSNLNTNPFSGNVETDPVKGTVTYSYEFNDRKLDHDTFEAYSVTKSATAEDYRVTVSISGTITGMAYPGETDPSIRITRAQDQWGRVKGLMLSRAVAESGITALKAFPITAEVEDDVANGSVKYNYSFDTRVNTSVKDEYTVSSRYNVEDGRTTVSVEGTITGLRTSGSDPFAGTDPYERFNNALAYFEGVEPNLIGLAALTVSTDKVRQTPTAKSVGHNKFGGIVTYQYEWASLNTPCTPGAISEVINIQEDDPPRLFAVIPILGQADGPTFQDLGTIKERRRTVSIECVFPIPSNVCASVTSPAIDVSRYAPSGKVVYQDSGTTQWSPTTGRASRVVSWVYKT